MKKIIIEECFLALISFIIVIILLIVPYYNQKNHNVLNKLENINNNQTYLEDIAFKYSVKQNEIEVYQINNKYENIIIRKEDILVSLILNSKSKDEVDISNLIKQQEIENFKELIKQEIFVKYPTFIANELIKEDTTYFYEFTNDGIIIHFDNYKTNPIYEKETYIKLTCPLINSYINYKCINQEGSLTPNVTSLDPNKKTVALTFDDGPHKYTTPILETLKNNHMHATFFQVGKNIKFYEETLVKMLEYGNEIGSHSFSHKSLTSCKEDILKEEIEGFEEAYNSITSKKVTLLRPPYGNINEKLKKELDYAFILWSVDPEDWKYKNVPKVVENVLNGVEDGDIILLHDIHYTTSEALKIILPELYVRGYQVVTVSDLAKLKGKTVEKNQIYRNFK